MPPVTVAFDCRAVSWLRQLAFLQAKGVNSPGVEHGMTHSVYIHDPNG